MRIALSALPVLLVAAPALAQQQAESDPQIDYAGFVELGSALQPVREAHRLKRDEFLRLAAAGDALLLDSRSAAAFAAGHIEGAVNLPFSDFTEESLRAVVGHDRGRAIFIYCNNNFTDGAAPVLVKKAALALNIPTFINLHGYGYTNVWELAGTMSTSEVPWVAGKADPGFSGALSTGSP